ncbi:hypothetical protein CTAYLR_006361 [Chrysophaeum taylorii]|uniref:JmjC domain-containing protein n=1 Tax=Chrysophaeum taylorii TaxID=2483200 RepID=A0AAD7U8G2_9STRA|nr:hypothetical protein CTAYLR_006361 [Chrysophaeum taylorii]
MASHLRRQRRRPRGYAGYRCRRGVERIVEVAAPLAHSPRNFFARFVARRRPCVLRSFAYFADLGIVSSHVGDPAGFCGALRRIAGDAMVRVEVRCLQGPRPFGLGRERRVRLKRFLDRATRRARRAEPCEWYLTTQDLDEDEEGRPSLAAMPSAALLTHGGCPLRPPVLPTLIPANFNLWIGAAADLDSSGLHHDFHDNLLVLVCGAKRLRLWDPSRTRDLRPAGGAPRRVFPNGRIVYASRPRVRQDGRDRDADEASRIARCLDEADDDDDIDRLLDRALDIETTTTTTKTKTSARERMGPPDNFARLPTTTAARTLPRLRAVDLRPGDAIFIPAGWWHDVQSRGGLHAAFNYWFHPPDTPSFSRPYASNFWHADFQTRLKDDPLLCYLVVDVYCILLPLLLVVAVFVVLGHEAPGSWHGAVEEEKTAARDPTNATSIVGSFEQLLVVRIPFLGWRDARHSSTLALTSSTLKCRLASSVRRWVVVVSNTGS